MKKLVILFMALSTGLVTKSLSQTSKDIPTLMKNCPERIHEFHESRYGRTHYEIRGAENKTTVLLIHGVSGPMHVWDRNVDLLAARGFRTIRLDLYGRGLSSRVRDAKYDLPMYISQVEALVKETKSENLILVGSSFGAVVCSQFALENPKKVRGLILIGPAGFPIQVPTIAKLRDVPILGDLIFFISGKQVILEQNRKYFYNLEPPPDFWSYFNEQLNVHGTDQAILSTMRNAPVQSFVDSYGRVGKLGIPIRVIWGRHDVTFPYENHEILRKQIPSMELVTIEQAAHLPQFEKADEVNGALVKFLERVDVLN